MICSIRSNWSLIFALFLFACGTDITQGIPQADTLVGVDSISSENDATTKSDGSTSDNELCDEAKERMSSDPCLICLCDDTGHAICEGVEVGAPCASVDCCYEETHCLQCPQGDDSCGESGLMCTGTPNVQCTNPNQCLKSFPVCTENTCTCSEAPEEAGTSCTADSNACTMGDFCADGLCIQGTDMDLEDGNPCTVGVCVKGEVVQQNLEGQCTDSNPCTMGEECKLGQCVATTLRECPLIACAQTAYCEPETGECAYEMMVDGVPCVLESACGTEGRCEQGECVPLGNQQEICDGLDNDCDGLTDEDQAVLQCGEGACFSQTPSCVDGVPQVCIAVQGTPEVCDSLDNDCDGLVDEDLGELSCGVGPCINTVEACIDGVEQWCLPQFNCCPNGMLEDGEECDDGDMADDDWCNNQCQETGQNCDDSDPISTSFIGIDNTSVGVGTWCNFGCFAYWSPLLDDIAWAWVCNGDIFVCPIGLTDCTGGCPHPECIPAD